MEVQPWNQRLLALNPQLINKLEKSALGSRASLVAEPVFLMQFQAMLLQVYSFLEELIFLLLGAKSGKRDHSWRSLGNLEFLKYLDP